VLFNETQSRAKINFLEFGKKVQSQMPFIRVFITTKIRDVMTITPVFYSGAYERDPLSEDSAILPQVSTYSPQFLKENSRHMPLNMPEPPSSRCIFAIHHSESS
jgi:hypothetical protein